MILKHTEYKVVCDGCWLDMTDYIPATKAQVRRYAKKNGVKFGLKDACLCDGCLKEMENLSQKAIEMNETWPNRI